MTARRVVCDHFDNCPSTLCSHKLPHDETTLCRRDVGCALAPEARCVDFMFKKDEAEGPIL